MKILSIGAGACGLGAAVLLARDGHDVTVLERDGGEPPASLQDAWDAWERSGVAQFRQPHNLMPGLRRLLERELPDVQAALPAAGAAKFDLASPLPRSFADQSPRPIDTDLWTWTARRPTFEWILATVASREPRLSVRRGVRVAELVAGASAASGIPHVAGVRTAEGEVIHADLVVDASGRQSRSAAWLEALGALPPDEESADCGFAYYTRYFRGTLPQRRTATLTPVGSISMLTLPGDNDVWSVTIFGAAGDQPLKALRHAGAWTRVVGACPLHAHWLEGDPISEVLPMAGIVDRYRRFVVGGTPVVTGFTAIADACACTNPSAGRGLTVGFLHALCLRDTLRAGDDDPRGFVERFDARTGTDVAPWYQAQLAVDRWRFADMEAASAGLPPPPPGDDLTRSVLSLLSTMTTDPELFRAALEYIATLTPVQTIVQRPEVAERVRAVRAAMKGAPPPQVPGPSRQQLLDLLR